MQVEKVCQCLFSNTSQKAQLRVPLSPLQTAWTSFNPSRRAPTWLTTALVEWNALLTILERVELLIELFGRC